MNINYCDECELAIPRKDSHTNSDYNRKMTCSKRCAIARNIRAKQIASGKLPAPPYKLTAMDCFILGKQDLLRVGA